MVNDKPMAVSAESHEYIRSQKIIPKEPYGDCLARILGEHKELKVLVGKNQVVEELASIPVPHVPTTTGPE